jgi:uncharacterized protein YcbX
MGMRLSGLFIHPVKSCAPLAVESARLHWRGLEHDRRWMVVDASGRFVTGRESPRLTLVRAVPDDGGLRLQAPDMPDLHVLVPPADASIPVTVWKSSVLARPCAADADAWLSQFFGKPVRLVHMDAGVHRPVQSEHARPGDEVSFADAFPLLLITQAALDGLNQRLATPVPMLRFRPNLVVSGALAHAEDTWKRIRIGDAELDIGPPCVRCVFTTVDPALGERDPSGEPLRTLIGYRRGAEGVTFGRNVIPRGGRSLRIGDSVEVLS